MTFLDGILSTATMLGLLLNATLGWWWADPAAAFLVGIAAASEARENWQEAAELSEDVERAT
jgi:divalent metal cation (Fe/Co/Zn/Cd) transporter